MKRIKLLAIGLLMAVLLLGGLAIVNKTVDVAGNTSCHIDSGFYVQQANKSIDPNFRVSLDIKALDSSFFVGRCSK